MFTCCDMYCRKGSTVPNSTFEGQCFKYYNICKQQRAVLWQLLLQRGEVLCFWWTGKIMYSLSAAALLFELCHMDIWFFTTP